MNESGVLTTREEVYRLVGMDYSKPKEECIFIGRLDSRNWFNKGSVYALICNFTTADNRKFSMFAFRHKRSNEIYSPKNCEIDFAHDVIDGSIWKCTIGMSKFGKLFWKNAELLMDHNDDDSILSYTHVESFTPEQVAENISARDKRRTEIVQEEREKRERRYERERKRRMKEDTWFGRRSRFIQKYREGKVTPKDMRMQAWEGEFVLSPDHTTIYCPKTEFKTRRCGDAAVMIVFPESCKSCDLEGCKGTYQKQFSMQKESYTSSSGYRCYNDPNNPFYNRR